MRLLLDTHIFLWYITADRRLPAAMLSRLRDPSNLVFLSVASIWESVIKYGLGKLPLPASPDQYLPTQRVRHGIASLAIDEASVARLASLPLIHRDPFDRILACPAVEHQLSIVTVDPIFENYPVSRL